MKSVIVAAAALAASLPSVAKAQCAMPAFEIIWSYPANGQTGIPTNAQVVVLTSVGNADSVVLDGAALSFYAGATQLRYATPALSADADHSLVVTGYGGSQTIIFRTGAGPMPSNPPVVEPSLVLYLGQRILDAQCARVLGAADCYDTGQDDYLSFSTSQAPTAWIVNFLSASGATQWSDLWPGVCGEPEIFVHSTDTTCYDLVAINEIGETSSSGPYCPRAQPPVVTHPPAGDCGTEGAAIPVFGALLWASALAIGRTQESRTPRPR